MLSIRFYLDARAVAEGSPAPLKLALNRRSRTALLKTGILLLPSEWDARTQQVINSPRRRVLNAELARMKASAEDYLRPMIYTGELAEKSVTEVKHLLDAFFNGERRQGLSICEAIRAFARTKSPHTRGVYVSAASSLCNHIPGFAEVTTKQMTDKYVERMQAALLEKVMPNTARSLMSCVAATWHDLMKQGVVTADVFKGRMPKAAQTRKRDLTAAQLRRLWCAECCTPQERAALDVFRLSFLLRAINMTDLHRAKLSDVENGRLYYARAKTGKAYSVKIEPEAQDIITRLCDSVHLIGKRFRYTDEKGLTRQTNNALRAICRRCALPEISTYWARHTLASLMFELGEPMDTVSAVLGHTLGGAQVTMTYVHIQEKKVDDAMRRVIDHVLSKID